jgi:hypothetical protein
MIRQLLDVLFALSIARLDCMTKHTRNERKAVIRIVLIGVSHWHTGFFRAVSAAAAGI